MSHFDSRINAGIEHSGDDSGETTVPAVTMSFLQDNERGSSAVDSYGYGLPEIVGTCDVTVPLIVGDQRVSTYSFH